jgi:Na+:H+ antiporter, NhaA family
MTDVPPRALRTPTTRPLIERVIGPFERFAHKESSGGLMLLACTVVALVWANSPWAASYQHLWEQPVSVVLGPLGGTTTLHHFINDGLMAVFFFLVGLEIKREVLVGELASLRKAALPLAGAAGGMLVPAAFYALLNAGGPGEPGWGIPMATDIAFALGVLTLLGDRVPVSLKVFLTALAIADDIGAVLVIALFYSTGVNWLALAAAVALLALSLGANLAGVRKPWAYALVGVLLWAAVLQSGVHATVAGVMLAFTIPARTRIDEAEFLERSEESIRRFDRALDPALPGLAARVLTNNESQEALHALEQLTEAAQPPLHRLEHGLHGLVAFGIMPLFALANAGVTLGGDVGAALASPVTLGIILGLVLGKPIGITLTSWLAVRAGAAAKPEGVRWASLHAVSWLGGIGFTMSLFVANLAFTGAGAGALLDAAKLGILSASLVAGIVGYTIMRRSTAPSEAPEVVANELVPEARDAGAL